MSFWKTGTVNDVNPILYLIGGIIVVVGLLASALVAYRRRSMLTRRDKPPEGRHGLELTEEEAEEQTGEQAVEAPEAFKSMPDHLTIELEVFCLFVEAGNASAAAWFAADHLSWIAGYRARLLGVRAATGIDRRLSDQARESCATGAAFADAALSLIEAYLEASLAEAGMPS